MGYEKECQKSDPTSFYIKKKSKKACYYVPINFHFFLRNKSGIIYYFLKEKNAKSWGFMC